MESQVEATSSALVVFGQHQIDTSRAEMLVQCLSNKIKEKRYKLQKLMAQNDEKRKRLEIMKNEKKQLKTFLVQVEQENASRERQLQSEQNRIKELQLNIQMLDEHYNSLKRDCSNDQRKFEQEKLSLIEKFERTKQQWTDIFKPQYEKSRVYQYLKQSDSIYTALLERKQTLLNSQKLANEDYVRRCEKSWKETSLQETIVSMAKCFLIRRDQMFKIEHIKTKIIQLEHQRKHLIEIKSDKMRAWESVYTQPMKRDLMNFCLQSNIDEALTVSFTQIQQDLSSQPSTPTMCHRTVSFNNEIEIMTMTPNQQLIENAHEYHGSDNLRSPLPGTTESSITIIPTVASGSYNQHHLLNHSDEWNRYKRRSVRHLTTAIEDDDDEIFSAAHRKLPTALMEKMSITDSIPSTQGFVAIQSHSNTAMALSKTMVTSPDQLSMQPSDISDSTSSAQSSETQALVNAMSNTNQSESAMMPLSITASSSPQLNSTFQLATPRPTNRLISTGSSSIQPQVTSTDVQQMLLNFSSSGNIGTEEQPQPMDEDNMNQTPQNLHKNHSDFQMISSIESTTSLEEEYNNFNYNFNFKNNDIVVDEHTNNSSFPSSMNFENWPNLGSPVGVSTNDQFSAFLQDPEQGVSNRSISFQFPTFNYADLNSNQLITDSSFGSFFFVNASDSTGAESISDVK